MVNLHNTFFCAMEKSMMVNIYRSSHMVNIFYIPSNSPKKLVGILENPFLGIRTWSVRPGGFPKKLPFDRTEMDDDWGYSYLLVNYPRIVFVG